MGKKSLISLELSAKKMGNNSWGSNQTWIARNELIYQNAAFLQHFWAKGIQRFLSTFEC